MFTTPLVDPVIMTENPFTVVRCPALIAGHVPSKSLRKPLRDYTPLAQKQPQVRRGGHAGVIQSTATAQILACEGSSGLRAQRRKGLFPGNERCRRCASSVWRGQSAGWCCCSSGMHSEHLTAFFTEPDIEQQRWRPSPGDTTQAVTQCEGNNTTHGD